ncbi:PIN domain-containing protein [Kovacikia minuta CCNUW1]|uniref:type II toxin-antitoxin system VapC family toxin n=1 Tax=Kovacikia minuta TaxID=2931930 RepID=UPI001CCB5707|nr:PIN domain-containing protein [Kovacikia minuta]UBF23666.1 PIN domain-containing protein [Kovacikia minuta CCNUW1]
MLDTGVLVALLSKADQFHQWATATVTTANYPLLTCEAVITETCFLLQRDSRSQQAVLSLIDRGAVQIAFCLSDEVKAIEELIDRYKNVPMSLADACLVRMAELHPESTILTLDSDFKIYRKHRNQEILIVMPSK